MGPRPSDDVYIHHKDRDKSNNCVTNLQWSTLSEIAVVTNA